MKMLTLLVAVSAFAQAPPSGMLPYTAILDPHFVPASQASFLQDNDILIGVAHGKIARAYPAADLAQHGSVNDEMPDAPIEVTWCGVCNTGAVFRARFKGRLLHFEYDSMVGANEVHKDHETGSRWQQSTGEAISGPLKGSRLDLYPFVRTTWKEWRRRYPETEVLKPLPGYDERMTNLNKMIRQNSLSGEGAAPKNAFGKDDRLRPKELVAGLTVGNETAAFPFSAMRTVHVINDRVGGVPVLVVHQPDSDTTTAFEARAKGETLRFEAGDPNASTVVDLETHSKWDAYGRCLEGPLKGAQLKSLILIPEFWFAWSEFHPQTRISQGTAQSPQWETLLHVPLPPDSEPKITMLSLPIGPSKPGPPPSMAHTHAGPVFGYILHGNIENQVDPDPPQFYTPGDFFYEVPGHIHRFLRSRSTTEPAQVIVFEAGATGKAAPVIKTLLEAPLLSTSGQQLSLRRLTLPGGSMIAIPARSNTAAVYVLEGEIDTAGVPSSRDSVFVLPASQAEVKIHNVSEKETAKLLLYAAD